MANSQTVAQVYADTCKLAYTESQMAINLRPPFKPANRARLFDQSGRCADVAKKFRETGDPAVMTQVKVDAASEKLRAAQSMFDYINTHTTNPFKAADVFKSADEATDAVAACLAQ